jgi:hypothetical protein
MSGKLSSSTINQIAGRQHYICANHLDSDLVGLKRFDCPLWKVEGPNQGRFNKAGFEIDHMRKYSVSTDDSKENLQALCAMCHYMKTKRFMNKKSTDDSIKKFIENAQEARIKKLELKLKIQQKKTEQMRIRILRQGRR